MGTRVWPSRQEWVAKAEQSVRTRCSMYERLPEGQEFATDAETAEGQELARIVAKAARPLLTAEVKRLEQLLGDRPKAGRARIDWFLALDDGRYRLAGDLAALEEIRRELARDVKARAWRGVEWQLGRIRKHYPAIVLDTETLATLDVLEALAAVVDNRRRAEARRLQGEAVAREVARRATDEAWAQELEWRASVESPRVIRT